MNITTDAGRRLAARLAQTEQEQLRFIRSGIGHLYSPTEAVPAAPAAGDRHHDHLFGISSASKPADSQPSGRGRFFDERSRHPKPAAGVNHEHDALFGVK